MRRILTLAFLAGLFLPAAAPGEVVHMRDGRKFVGKVIKEGSKYRIEMEYGTITVDTADVIYVLQGGTTRPARRATPAVTVTRPPIRVRPKARWSMNKATRPEPVVFMLTRQLELLAGDMGTQAIARQLEEWKKILHDGKRRVGDTWLSREEQRRRRAEFERRVAKARKLASELRRYARPSSDAEKAKARRLEMAAIQDLYAAATVWPDAIIREFLAGTLDLRAKNYKRAEQRFSNCIDAEPLVAAFHQGRGIALIGLNQHLQALEEFSVCLQLRDDSFRSLELVREAMRVTPGAKMKDPAYVKAKDLLAQYEKPKTAYRTRSRRMAWLMPGRLWQLRDETLFTPPYDRLVSKQALAVPIAEGALLLDANTVRDAQLIYVQAGPDMMVRADAARSYSYSSGKSGLPLAVIRTTRVKFTPVKVEEPAALQADQTVTIRAVNVYRQMGTEIRTRSARVTAAGADGVKLDRTLLPGEGVAAAFLGEAFAGFLTARCKPEEPGCGKSTFIKPSELTEWVNKIKRTLAGRSRYTRYGRPELKGNVAKKAIEGQVFLVHIILGEKPPREFGK